MRGIIAMLKTLRPTLQPLSRIGLLCTFYRLGRKGAMFNKSRILYICETLYMCALLHNTIHIYIFITLYVKYVFIKHCAPNDKIRDKE